MREHDERRLTALLREEADRHRPDRDAMLERITRTRDERRAASPFFRLRPLAAAAAVAVLVLSIAGVRLFATDPVTPVDPDQVAAPSSPVSTPSGTPSRAPSASPSSPPSRTSSPASPTAPSSVPSSAPSSAPSSGPSSARGGDSDRFVTSVGLRYPNDNPDWTQAESRLTFTDTVTALEVTISVVHSDGVSSTGQWSSVPSQMTALGVEERDGKLVYRFTLMDGANPLAPGEYRFAAQYNHARGVDPAVTYQVRATASGSTAEVSGSF